MKPSEPRGCFKTVVYQCFKTANGGTKNTWFSGDESKHPKPLGWSFKHTNTKMRVSTKALTLTCGGPCKHIPTLSCTKRLYYTPTLQHSHPGYISVTAKACQEAVWEEFFRGLDSPTLLINPLVQLQDELWETYSRHSPCVAKKEELDRARIRQESHRSDVLLL